MARRRVDPTTPPLSREESIDRARAARRVVSRAEQQKRFRFVEDLLAVDASVDDIAAQCRERLGMSVSAVERTKSRVLAAWANADRSRSMVRREQARRRLLDLRTRALEKEDIR